VMGGAGAARSRFGDDSLPPRGASSCDDRAGNGGRSAKKIGYSQGTVVAIALNTISRQRCPAFRAFRIVGDRDKGAGTGCRIGARCGTDTNGGAAGGTECEIVLSAVRLGVDFGLGRSDAPCSAASGRSGARSALRRAPRRSSASWRNSPLLSFRSLSTNGSSSQSIRSCRGGGHVGNSGRSEIAGDIRSVENTVTAAAMATAGAPTPLSLLYIFFFARCSNMPCLRV
jgi:hypothetical protein